MSQPRTPFARDAVHLHMYSMAIKNAIFRTDMHRLIIVIHGYNPCTRENAREIICTCTIDDPMQVAVRTISVKIFLMGGDKAVR